MLECGGLIVGDPPMLLRLSHAHKHPGTPLAYDRTQVLSYPPLLLDHQL